MPPPLTAIHPSATTGFVKKLLQIEMVVGPDSVHAAWSAGHFRGRWHTPATLWPVPISIDAMGSVNTPPPDAAPHRTTTWQVPHPLTERNARQKTSS